jgi:hypothetical protein
MEASTVTGSEQEGQAAPQAPQTVEPTQTQEGSQSAAAPDLSEQFSDLAGRMEKLEGANQEAPQSEEDLFGALTGLDPNQVETDDLTLEDIAALQEMGIDPALLGLDGTQQFDPYAQQQEGDPRYDELAQRLEAQEAREVDRELAALKEELPDIQEPGVWEPLSQRLSVLAQQYGDKVLTDPGVVRTVYQAVKAEQADAASTPAGEAGKQGASLETNAGRSQQGGTDPSEQFADTLMRATGGGSAFTR